MFLPLLVGALMIGAIYGLMGLACSLIYRASALMSFAQGEFLMMGAFLGLILFRDNRVPYLITLLICIMTMLLAGFLMERFIIRIILNKGGRAIQIVLVTMGISILLQNLAVIFLYSDVQMFPPILNVHYIDFGLVRIAPESIMGAGMAIVFMILLQFFMTKTKMGTAMRAAAQVPDAASVCGINVSFTKGLTWGISTMLTAMAGLMIGPVYGVQPAMGYTIGLKGFAAAVIGGYGNMLGAVIGGFFMGFVETMAAGYIASDMKDFVSFSILIVFLLVKPTGIFNAKIIEQ
ncbi:MAG: branched-chain amino acid ABC transporter permease [Treponema sp.]|jgi:branched-chain amino acid transport system permease protein|nr:branched-chain amino acid ABC transporter permease [Treponema sp.]